jgi:hypothetical protein
VEKEFSNRFLCPCIPEHNCAYLVNYDSDEEQPSADPVTINPVDAGKSNEIFEE